MAFYLPPALTAAGYERYAAIEAFLQRAAVDPEFESRSKWAVWRSYLDYLACVEFGRWALLQLPRGRALGSVDVVPARHHSIALVFTAQALLDNLAEWLRAHWELGSVKHGNTAFHKSVFLAALAEVDAPMHQLLSEQSQFIARLERYRHAWIHRVAGGACMYAESAQTGDAPDFDTVKLAVPIDPTIDPLAMSHVSYVAAVEASQAANGGRWLFEIDEFANMIADGTRDLLLAVLSRVLARLPI